LLLLHSNPCDSRDFDAIIPALARKFTVVTIDWPGYGQSTARNPGQVTAEGLVAVAEQVLHALAARRIRRLAIIGNSVGGYVAVRLAQPRQPSIASLILVDPGGFTPQHPVVRASCRHVMGSSVIARQLITPLARAYLGRLRTPSARATYSRARKIRHQSPQLEVHWALWRSFAYPYFDLTTISPTLAVPTLLIWGWRDRYHLPRSTVAERGGPCPMPVPCFYPPDMNRSTRDPKPFLDQVVPFLRQHAGTGHGNSNEIS
jgi:pimeloyl-ACP methyl ester carboxylesterase